jgi:hypothetical protein
MQSSMGFVNLQAFKACGPRLISRSEQDLRGDTRVAKVVEVGDHDAFRADASVNDSPSKSRTARINEGNVTDRIQMPNARGSPTEFIERGSDDNR